MEPQSGRKRILVTGGAGFIGSHLIDRLAGEGHAIWCVDNLYTGSKQNLASVLQNPNVTYVQHDVTDALHLEVDEIYNLACPASPIHYQYDPIQTMKTSVFGAMNMLELAKSQNARILQASTSEVYGDPQIARQPETYWGHVNPIGPRACYDEGKRSAETLFFDYHRQHRVDIKVARIFNTYGPRIRTNDGRVVSNFIVQALRGDPLTIYGDGSYTRSFCFVDDLVGGLVSLMNTEPEFTGPINLGNDREVSMLELAELIIKLTQSRSPIEFQQNVPDDPKRRCPDLTRARRDLNWTPRVTLEDGLARTIAAFRALTASAV